MKKFKKDESFSKAKTDFYIVSDVKKFIQMYFLQYF